MTLGLAAAMWLGKNFAELSSLYRINDLSANRPGQGQTGPVDACSCRLSCYGLSSYMGKSGICGIVFVLSLHGRVSHETKIPLPQIFDRIAIRAVFVLGVSTCSAFLPSLLT